jgi:DnaK suppressor protein
VIAALCRFAPLVAIQRSYPALELRIDCAPMDPDRARELLANERQRIERALRGLAPEADRDEADDLDLADAASDLAQEELDEGLADDLREQLAAVERAEERLAAGTYGVSIESGEPIPDERLEARPTAELTTEEERARES